MLIAWSFTGRHADFTLALVNILILSHFAGSSKHGMIYRNYALAHEWLRQGHNVTVIASSYSHYRQIQPETKGRITQETIDGIRYIWVKTHPYVATSNLGRVSNMLSFTAQCMWLPLPLSEGFDIIMCSSPHPLVIYPAYKLTQRFNCRLIYDIRDLWPLTVKMLGNISEKHPFIRLLQHAEDYACKHADLVTAVPHNAQDYLASRGLPKERFLPIANGVAENPSEPEPLPPTHSEIMDAVTARAKYIIGYVGTLGTANAMADVIHAMSRISESVHLAILGDGSERNSLQILANDLNLNNRVHFLSPVSRQQVQSFLKYIDIGYAGTNKSPLYQYGASLTKINDYMVAGLPIIYAVGDPNNAVELSKAGISCNPGDSSEIAAAINQITNMTKEQLVNIGHYGKEWCIKNQLISTQANFILTKLNDLPKR